MAPANKHLEKAERLLQKGKIKPALQEYLHAWHEDLNNDSIVYTIAELYQGLNNTKEALECYGYMLDKSIERSDVQKTIEILRKMQIIGSVAPAKSILAAKLLEEKRPELASDQLRRAMKLAGEEDLEIKIQCLRGLLRLQPASIDLSEKLAEAAGKAGKPKIAVSAYKGLAGLMATMGKWPEAVTALEQACRLAPKDMETQFSLAQGYLKAGQPADVMALWKGEEQRSEDPKLLQILAKAFQQAGEPEKAEAIYWKLLPGNPAIADSIQEVARIYVEQDQVQSAASLMQRVQNELAKGSAPREIIKLAEQLCELEHNQISILEPLTHLMDQLRLDSPLVKALNTLFSLHSDAGDFDAAVDTLERLVAVDPYNAQIMPRPRIIWNLCRGRSMRPCCVIWPAEWA